MSRLPGLGGMAWGNCEVQEFLRNCQAAAVWSSLTPINSPVSLAPAKQKVRLSFKWSYAFGGKGKGDHSPLPC